MITHLYNKKQFWAQIYALHHIAKNYLMTCSQTYTLIKFLNVLFIYL